MIIKLVNIAIAEQLPLGVKKSKAEGIMVVIMSAFS
jgi:hypothetical protein